MPSALGGDSRELIARAPDGESSTVQDVGVYHRRPDVFVPEQFLHGPDVIAGREQVRRKRVPNVWQVTRLVRPALRAALRTK